MRVFSSVSLTFYINSSILTLEHSNTQHERSNLPLRLKVCVVGNLMFPRNEILKSALCWQKFRLNLSQTLFPLSFIVTICLLYSIRASATFSSLKGERWR